MDQGRASLATGEEAAASATEEMLAAWTKGVWKQVIVCSVEIYFKIALTSPTDDLEEEG